MDPALIPALLAFAFVSSITPGPNNLMLMASGANFGLRRSLPHMFGVGLGHSFLIVVVGLFLMGVFDAVPLLRQALTVLGVAYLLWLSWKIATSAPKEGQAGGRPLTFLQAAAFQWVNPKGWFMAIGAITFYATQGSAWGVLAVAAMFFATNLPSIAVWTVLGQQMRRFLTSPGRLRAFNWTMAGLLVLSLWPVVSHEWQALAP